MDGLSAVMRDAVRNHWIVAVFLVGMGLLFNFSS